jgi:nucleotide-binding universal stress UspA family protein
MYHVLLPVDSDVERSHAAADVVTGLPAAETEVSVTILNVQPEVELSSGDGSHVSSEDWWDPDDVPESVTATREYLESEGIDVEVRREHEDPARCIIRVSEEAEADLIVMAGRVQSPVGKVLFGSVTQSVLLSSSVPVTVVGSD